MAVTAVAQRARIPASTYWCALACAGIVGFSRLSFGVLMPAIKHALPASYGTYGWVAGSNFDGFLLGIVALPFALRLRFDRHRANAIAIALTAIFMFCSGFSGNLIELSVWRFLTGITAAVATMLTAALAVDAAPAELRGRVSGIVWMGSAAGMALCGIAAPLTAPGGVIGWREAWFGMGVLLIVVLPGLQRSLAGVDPSPEPSTANRKDFLNRNFLLLGVTFLLFGLGFVTYVTYIVSFASELGINSNAIGTVWAAMGIAGAAGSYLWGRFFDRFGQHKTVALVMATGSAGAFAVFLHVHALTAIGALLVGAAAFGVPTQIGVLLRRVTTANTYATVFSAATAIYGFGQVVAPPLGGALADNSGLLITIAFAGCGFAVGAIVALFVDQRRMA